MRYGAVSHAVWLPESEMNKYIYRREAFERDVSFVHIAVCIGEAVRVLYVQEFESLALQLLSP